MKEVERSLKNRSLRRQFPDLCKIIVDRHKSYLKNKKKENDLLLYNEVYRIGKELYELGIYPSWKSIVEKSVDYSEVVFKSPIAHQARDALFTEFNISKSINQYASDPNFKSQA